PTRRSSDLQALADLRHLDLEQLLQEAAVRAAEEQLRTARLGAHVLEIGADAIARTHRLARNHLLAGDEGLGVAAEIDEHVAALDTFDDAGDQFALAVTVLVDDLGALRLAHLLHDDLLGGLRGDAAEGHRFHGLLDVAAHLDVRRLLARLAQANLLLRELDLGVILDDQPAAEGLVAAGMA